MQKNDAEASMFEERLK